MSGYENPESPFPWKFGAEHFIPPTAETIQAFNTQFERLSSVTDRIGTVGEESLTMSIAAPDKSGYLIIVDCGLYKHQPLNDSLDERIKLSVSIAQRVDAPTPNPGELVQRKPLKKRTFMHGRVYEHIRGGASLSDEEFSAAMAHLEITVPEVQWEWIDVALKIAGSPQDSEFLPFLVAELLDTSPFPGQVSRGREYYMNDIYFRNGALLKKANWSDANAMYLSRQSDFQPIRRINLISNDNKEYRYEAYADGTEQITINSVHEKHAPISPNERSSGLYSLTESQVNAFTRALQEALDSGLRF